jgi:UDP-glucose 4-epimerase
MSNSVSPSSASSDERWLITGGCGFIGRNLIRLLLEEGISPGNIRALDNFSVGAIDDLKMVTEAVESGVGWGGNAIGVFEGDIRYAETIEEGMQGATHVVHLAACTGVVPSVENPRFDCEQNVMGMLNVLEYCRAQNIQGFVFASSSAPLGAATPPIHEGMPSNPASPYGASKLAGEGYCQAYANCFDVPTTILRFGNVYGTHSGHKESLVAKFISRAMQGQPLEIYGDGTATRDFIYVEDLCEAIIMGARLDPSIKGEIYQIATHRETTVQEITDMLVAVMEERGVKGIKVNNIAPRQGDVQRSFSDVSKARDQLGWEARTALRDGLGSTVDWFVKTGA